MLIITTLALDFNARVVSNMKCMDRVRRPLVDSAYWRKHYEEHTSINNTAYHTHSE